MSEIGRSLEGSNVVYGAREDKCKTERRFESYPEASPGAVPMIKCLTKRLIIGISFRGC